jgi:hypothetical protein
VSVFTPDNRPRGGRPPGARNRLSKAILDDLLADWREHGAAAIKLMRLERPADYVRAAISTLPKELLFETTATTAELNDDEVYELIHQIKLQLAEDRPLMIEAKVAPDEK